MNRQQIAAMCKWLCIGVYIMTQHFEMMTEEEVVAVAGGFTGPTSCTGDIVTDLTNAFPGGVWDGSTFYPNGLPRNPNVSTDPVIYAG